MAEFDERVREAFHDDLQRMPPPAGLRQRIVTRAVQTPQSRWRTVIRWVRTRSPRRH